LLRRPDIAEILITFAVLVISLSIHEAAHAWSANRLGDPTARLLGRLTLNPVAHVDPIGTLLLPLVGLMTTGSFIGWAKPVPVTINNLRGNWQQKYMLIAAAGPASNLLIATVAAIVLHVISFGSPFETSMEFGGRLLLLVVRLNVLLAVFNMVPVPPLDGGNVLMGLLPRHLAEPLGRLRPYGFLIIVGLAVTGILWAFIDPIRSVLLRILL
jgi:Zn-dependent protease